MNIDWKLLPSLTFLYQVSFRIMQPVFISDPDHDGGGVPWIGHRPGAMRMK